MTIPFGIFRLSITLTKSPGQANLWEEMVAVEMNDRELSRLNLANTHDPVQSPWGMSLLLIHGRMGSSCCR